MPVVHTPAAPPGVGPNGASTSACYGRNHLEHGTADVAHAAIACCTFAVRGHLHCAELARQARELDGRPDAHPTQQKMAMHLDGPLADPEVHGDHFVRLAEDDVVEDLALTVRELG